jgi:hypothetical protein
MASLDAGFVSPSSGGFDMSLKSLVKKAKAVLTGKKKGGAPEVEPPPTPTVTQSPEKGDAPPLPLRGWQGAKPGGDGSGEAPKLGQHRTPAVDKPKTEGKVPVLGGHRAPKVTVETKSRTEDSPLGRHRTKKEGGEPPVKVKPPEEGKPPEIVVKAPEKKTKEEKKQGGGDLPPGYIPFGAPVPGGETEAPKKPKTKEEKKEVAEKKLPPGYVQPGTPVPGSETEAPKQAPKETKAKAKETPKVQENLPVGYIPFGAPVPGSETEAPKGKGQATLSPYLVTSGAYQTNGYSNPNVYKTDSDVSDSNVSDVSDDEPSQVEKLKDSEVSAGSEVSPDDVSDKVEVESPEGTGTDNPYLMKNYQNHTLGGGIPGMTPYKPYKQTTVGMTDEEIAESYKLGNALRDEMPMATNYRKFGEKPNSMQLLPSSTVSVTPPSDDSESLPPVTYGNKVPDVQPTVAKSKDKTTAKLQENLRRNAIFNKDTDEVMRTPQGHEYMRREVKREGLSNNEQSSKGWAQIGIREGMRDQETYKGRERGLDSSGALGNTTKYLLSEGQVLTNRAEKLLKDNLKAGAGQKREDFVLRFVDGKFVNSGGQAVDTTSVAPLAQEVNEFINKITGKLDKHPVGEKLSKLKGKLDSIKSVEGQKQLGLGGRYIFVMNAAGQIFAGPSQVGIMHHSSFLAGGAVAGAGEIQIAGGAVTAISNTSGHYRPGPAYLWQVCKQLEMLGCPMDSVKVDVMGVPSAFKSAAEFLGAMNPAEDPAMFDAGKAIDHLKQYLARKKSKPPEVEKQVEDLGKQAGEDDDKKPKV